MTNQAQGLFIAEDDPIVAEIEEAHRAYGDSDLAEPHRWIIATHECCFVGKGATLEVIRATFSSAKQPTKKRSGHSPRSLAAELGDMFVIIDSDHRVVLRRTAEQRESIRREACLTGRSLHIFKQWLGNRYRRSALPDKVGDFLSARGIFDRLSSLLDELPETAEVLIRGHELADDLDEAETVAGIRLIVLLEPGADMAPEAVARRAEWCDRVRALGWADEDAPEPGVALDGIECVPADRITAAEFLLFDRLDLEWVSHRHLLDRTPPARE